MQEYFKQQLIKMEKFENIDINYQEYKFNQVLASEIISAYIRAIRILDEENIVSLRNCNLKNYIDEKNEGINDPNKSIERSIKGLLNDLIENETDNNKIIKMLNSIGNTFGINYSFSSIIQNSGIISAYNGDFTSAFEFSKISAEYCGDEKAFNFIRNIDNLNKFIYKYNLCIDMLKQNMYEEVKVILEEQKKLGFRTRNSDTILCILYLLNKDYQNCEIALNNIYNIDKSSLLYFEVTNELQKSNQSKKRKRQSILASFIGVCLALNIYQGYLLLNKKTKQQIKYVVKTITVKDKKTEVVDNSTNYIQMLTNLSNYMLNSNYYGFEVEKNRIDTKKLSESNLKVYNQLNQKYTAVAGKYFYNKGLELFKARNYPKSYEYFSIANKYKKGDFLDQHILFMLAKSGYLSSQNSTTDYYNQYVNKYSNGCYIEEALYDLTMMSLKGNKLKEAKDYASRLVTKYPKSKFSNEKVKAILNDKK